MKKTALLLGLFASFNLIGQIKNNNDKINIEIVKSKIVDNESFFGVRQLRITNDNLNKVMVKTKIASGEDDKTKLSAFSLLDTVNKIRYRLADYKGYNAFIGNPELLPYRKSRIYNEKGKELSGNWLPEYDTSVKDFFDQYDKIGYTNFEAPVAFATGSKGMSIVYFGETIFEKFTAELFFAILKQQKQPVYELYYKDRKVAQVNF